MHYLMTKTTFWESNSDTIQPIAGDDKGARTFSWGISPKVNAIVQLESISLTSKLQLFDLTTASPKEYSSNIAINLFLFHDSKKA